MYNSINRTTKWVLFIVQEIIDYISDLFVEDYSDDEQISGSEESIMNITSKIYQL